ncbi:MAG: F0F1 ATP synthase subunit A [Proteobacteria bacterium]|nr:F0F1 ATP synthase subunit A [Pseudomonadota bacterium]
MANPLEQFRIKPIVELPIGSVDASFTNSSLFMLLAVVLIALFLTLSMRGRALVPGRWQSMAELAYEFVANMVRENVGSEGRRYFPFIFSLFMFILFGNLLGLVPFGFTFTSHIIVTFGLAITVFTGVTLVALVRHGFKFFTYFFPSGAPVAMAPLLVPIEILSYCSRPVTLAIRLFANMMAGHTMLKIFAGFTVGLGAITYGIGGIGPVAVNVALTAFEFLVAVLQAYVFTVLTCLYLHDAIHLH